MNKLKLTLPALLIVAVAACSPSSHSTATQTANDSTSVVTDQQNDTALTAKMKIMPSAMLQGPVEMSFTVYNNTDSTRTFCKWHTPFEPLMSKYLDVTASTGEEVMYKGPMAKRIMPPPADSYISLKPNDSLSVKVDLLKAYDMKTPAVYTIKYNSEGISGLKVTDSVRITLK